MIRPAAPVILFSLLISSSLYGAPLSSKQMKSIEEFEVSKEPAKRDWQSFHKADPSFRSELWKYHQKRKIDFSAWSWGWRMGWVRSCSQDPKGYCADILEKALFDKALVVRAEAATQLGRIFDNTKNEKFSNLLLNALNNPKNFRNKKPLFVQQRILFAIKQIGNTKAMQESNSASKTHPDLAIYWSKISKI
jgi:hypothetical protein